MPTPAPLTLQAILAHHDPIASSSSTQLPPVMTFDFGTPHFHGTPDIEMAADKEEESEGVEFDELESEHEDLRPAALPSFLQPVQPFPFASSLTNPSPVPLPESMPTSKNHLGTSWQGASGVNQPSSILTAVAAPEVEQMVPVPTQTLAPTRSPASTQQQSLSVPRGLMTIPPITADILAVQETAPPHQPSSHTVPPVALSRPLPLSPPTVLGAASMRVPVAPDTAPPARLAVPTLALPLPAPLASLADSPIPLLTPQQFSESTAASPADPAVQDAAPPPQTHSAASTRPLPLATPQSLMTNTPSHLLADPSSSQSTTSLPLEVGRPLTPTSESRYATPTSSPQTPQRQPSASEEYVIYISFCSFSKLLMCC